MQYTCKCTEAAFMATREAIRPSIPKRIYECIESIVMYTCRICMDNSYRKSKNFRTEKIRIVNIRRFQGRLRKFLKFTHLILNLTSSAQSKNECL